MPFGHKEANNTDFQTSTGSANEVRSVSYDMPTILVVDDEKNIRLTVRMILEGEGYIVEEAASGEEALARLPDIAPDVILLDVQLPGLSGHDVLESMRKTHVQDEKNAKAQPEPTVIMISGHGALADAIRATKAGAYDFLEKPLHRERMITILRAALERRAMDSLGLS